jgi:hypothetical protein
MGTEPNPYDPPRSAEPATRPRKSRISSGTLIVLLVIAVGIVFWLSMDL